MKIFRQGCRSIKFLYFGCGGLVCEKYNNYINKYTIFKLFPTQNIINILLANLTEFYEEMSEDEKKKFNI